jgi:hypothetical protein
MRPRVQIPVPKTNQPNKKPFNQKVHRRSWKEFELYHERMRSQMSWKGGILISLLLVLAKLFI